MDMDRKHPILQAALARKSLQNEIQSCIQAELLDRGCSEEVCAQVRFVMHRQDGTIYMELESPHFKRNGIHHEVSSESDREVGFDYNPNQIIKGMAESLLRKPRKSFLPFADSTSDEKMLFKYRATTNEDIIAAFNEILSPENQIDTKILGKSFH